MTETPDSCVLLADRHHGLAEGLRGLLGAVFETVVMVADEASLAKAASRLQPQLAVVDLSLARENQLEWIRHLHENCPGLKLIILSVHDEPTVCRAVMEAGADGFVLKRAAATDLLTAVDAVLAGGQFASSG